MPAERPDPTPPAAVLVQAFTRHGNRLHLAETGVPVTLCGRRIDRYRPQWRAPNGGPCGNCEKAKERR
jgi:hypothetical protein